ALLSSCVDCTLTRQRERDSWRLLLELIFGTLPSKIPDWLVLLLLFCSSGRRRRSWRWDSRRPRRPTEDESPITETSRCSSVGGMRLVHHQGLHDDLHLTK